MSIIKRLNNRSILSILASGFVVGISNFIIMEVIALLMHIPQVGLFLEATLYIIALLINYLVLRKKRTSICMGIEVIMILSFCFCFYMNTSFHITVNVYRLFNIVTTAGSDFFSGLSWVLFVALVTFELIIMSLLSLFSGRQQ